MLWFLVENKGWGEWLLRMLGIWGPGHEGKYLLIYENFSNYTNLSSQVGSRGAGWSHLSEPKVSMVSLPGKGGKRVSLLGYFSRPVYPHDCQEREEVRSKSMLYNDLGPGKDPKLSFVITYLSIYYILSQPSC